MKKRYAVDVVDATGKAETEWTTWTRWGAEKLKRMYGTNVLEPIPGKPLYSVRIRKL